MRVVPMRIRGGKYRSRCYPWVIGVFMGGVALFFFLATAAPVQSALPPGSIWLTPTTDASGTGTTTATSAPGSQAQAGTTAQAGAAAVIPPAAGVAPLNPGWKTDQMVVRVWPEYDNESVLVIMNFSLPAQVQLPATLKFAIPKGALIAGIAEITPNNTFKYNYGNSYPPLQSGADWDIATIQVQQFRSLQIDYYYDPGLPAGAGGRSFPLLLQVPLDAGTLELQVQEPARATDFKVQPLIQRSGKAEDGFAYAGKTFPEVKAGSTLGYVVSYSKPDGDPSTNPKKSAPAEVSTNNVLLAAILIIVVCIGGFVVYRLYRNPGRATSTPTKGRARPRTRPSPAAPPVAVKDKRPAGNARHVATNRGEAGSRFCIACGEELIKKARYCGSCGEAQDG